MLVLGDGMADWLAYGLEDAYFEQPDMGVIRKHKTVSGLIKYQPKGEPSDWAAAAKGILAAEKPDVIVVMLGTERPRGDPRTGRGKVRQESRQEGRPTARPDAKPGEANPEQAGRRCRRHCEARGQPADTEAAADDADNDAPSAVAPEKTTRSANGLYEFRDDRWVELYAKKIEEMIGVLKSKGVPVLWVGLPAVRGQRATSDMLFLNSLYRDAAGKAGITYVDVWDGFVDEAGRFLQRGPTSKARPASCAPTTACISPSPARASWRIMSSARSRACWRHVPRRSRCRPNPRTPDANAVPGQPAPRPLAGPILPLVASSVGTDQLLGGPGSRPAAVDALAARTLVKGEPLAPPAGRADDFVWPRREVGREQAKGETPVAAVSPEAPAAAVPGAAPKPAPRKLLLRPTPPAPAPFGNFFSFGPAARQAAPPPPRPPAAAPPRPPGVVGRSASVPGPFTR